MMIPSKQNMMRRMLTRAARARREHGVALLFTLCILSMALITAMILSSAASTSRKVAAVHVDSTAARILADGAVSRAILGLMHSENVPYACSNYMTLPPGGTANYYASDWIWKLEKTGVFSFDKGPIRFDRTSYYKISDSLCPSWEYVYDYAYGDRTNERIFGRFAYVAIGQNDQLNPNAIGKRSYSDFDNTVYQKRLGRWTCEPQFIFKSVQNGWNYSSTSPIISPTTIAAKYADPGWNELDVFVDDMAGSTSDKQLKMMLDQYFDVSGKEEYNKYSPGGNAISDLSKYETSGDERYRFPLIRTDWNSIDIGALKNAIPWFGNATGNANVDQTLANLINYNADFNRDPVSSSNNWYTDEVTFTGNKRTPYINEVYADVSVGGHIGMRSQRPVYPDPGNPSLRQFYVWYTDCSYSHEITVHVETVNMFNGIGGEYGAIQVGNPVLFGGEVSYEYYSPQNDTWKKVTVPFERVSSEATVTKNGSDGGYQDYVFMLDSGPIDSLTTPEKGPYDRPMGHDADFYEFLKVRNVKVSLDRVILHDTTGRNADLALMPDQIRNSQPLITGGEIVAGPGDFSRHVYFDAQVNDPRFNLARNQWGNQAVTTDVSTISETIGSRNSSISLGSYHDYEEQDDPVYNGSKSISTAYIRHGQMQSLWELGAIHRGAPWQTINLKCAAAKGTGMDTYQAGDGHLLDQVALASSTDRATDAVFGLINLNCVASFGNAPFVFKSLFTNFPVYKSYANMNAFSAEGGFIQGDAVDSEKSGNMDADTYAEELSNGVSFAVKNGYFPRRTAVFPTSYPAPAGNPMEHIIPKNVPDAQSEEIFARVVNLLKWNRQQTKRATILVLAQTIKDTGGVSLEKSLPKNDTDLMRDAGFQAFDNTNKKTTTLMPSGIRSTYGDKSRAVKYKTYDNFLDQITGEAKLIVRLEWDESANNNKGAWKITRKEYAE